MLRSVLLVEAFLRLRRSCPCQRLCLGCHQVLKACIGAPEVGKTRACKVGPGEAGIVDSKRCFSTAPLVDLQRTLMSIFGMLCEAEVTFSLLSSV